VDGFGQSRGAASGRTADQCCLLAQRAAGFGARWGRAAGCGRRHGDIHTDPLPHRNAHRHTQSYADLDAYCHANRDPDTHANRDPDTQPHGHHNPYANTDPYRNADPEPNSSSSDSGWCHTTSAGPYPDVPSY
jgi:hypothetical protein